MLPSTLLERRPDIAAAERRMASANAAIGVATAAYYPTVTLGGQAGLQSSDWSKWFTWPSHFWSIGPSLSYTLIDGGLRRAQLDQARAAYRASVATYRQTVLAAFQGVEDNLAALGILGREARVQERAVEAARKSLALVMDQYRAGLVSYLNVVTAQATLLSSQVTWVQIHGRRITATVLLVQALGGGWDTSLLRR
jgi:NodT family efflux transporter outer membrane factor (OMF) lipoprotein